MKRLFIFFTALMAVYASFANNVQLSDIVYNNGAGTVSFSISWENSWRVSTAPNNWDAAWVFVKRRNCADQFWKQQYLAASGHTAAGSLEVQTVPDSVGVFIRRSSNGSGNIASTAITLKLGSVPVPLNEWDFKVFAIEMTFVPQGAFSVGDGGTNYYSFREGGSGVPGTPFKITSESAITFANTAGNLWDAAAATSNYAPGGNSIGIDFPKGYRGFYAMKYEISQGQYTDFLNSLPQDVAQSKQVVTNTYRNTVTGVWPLFTCNTPNRAMSNFNWSDLCSYLDWSGLAPMSELEFEKLSRGVSTPVANEFAWGLNTATRAFSVVNDGTNQEGVSETVAVGTGLGVYGGNTGNGPQGPLRVGFAAKNATSRAEAGSGYYGNMELTGNVAEFVTGVHGTAGATFKWDAHGDGNIPSPSGLSNVSGWVNQTAKDNSAAGAAASLKGGSWTNRIGVSVEDQSLRVSDRYYSSNSFATANINIGGRGVRRVFN
jgi:formylglycine-generating enzyme required for sulfatase activity